MKWSFLLLVFLCGAGWTHAQPPVCISQEAANKCASAAAELIEARKVIQDFQAERATTTAERAAAQTLINGLNDLIAVKDRIDAEKDKVIEMYTKVVAMQQSIIESLEKRLNRPKSALQKFVDALKTIGYIAAGIALGRGL